MSFKKNILLVLLAMVCFSAAAQTVVKIPFNQPEEFVVKPDVVSRSFDDKPSMEIGTEVEIVGGSGHYTFSWYLNDVVVGNEPTLLITQKGLYKLSIDDGEGCASTISYYIDTSTGVIVPDTPLFTVYPNPGNGLLHVRPRMINEPLRIEIFSMDGARRMAVPVAGNDDVTIDATALPAGNYLIVLFSAYERITRVIVIR